MPKVRFLQDFQGKETREQFHKKGEEVEIEDYLVAQLVADGRVEVVTAPVADVHKAGGKVEVVEHDEAPVEPVEEVKPAKSTRRRK